ncbi:hypothetical protein ACHAXS_004694 [Conticribra weissflogii]
MSGADVSERATSAERKSLSCSWPNNCKSCPCQTFSSADAVTSAVYSEARTQALIEFLSNSFRPPRVPDQTASPLEEGSTPCKNRLQASIVVLNAIRDACRPFLESPTTPTPISSNGPTGKNSTHRHLVPTYEDSFPPLSANSQSVAAPTLLVGRKKSKGKKCNSMSALSSTNKNATSNSYTVNTFKISAISSDTTKRIKPVADALPANTSISWGSDFPPLSKGSISPLPPRTSEKIKVPQEMSPKINLQESNKHSKTEDLGFVISKIPNVVGSSIPEAETTFLHDDVQPKSKNRPASDSTKTASNNFDGNDLHKSEGSSQLRSSATSSGNTEIDSDCNKHTHKSTELESKKGSFVVNVSCSPKIPRPNPRNPSFASVQDGEFVERLVMIYSTILKNRLAPCLLLELHLLVRLLTIHDNPHKHSANRMILPNVAFFQIFSSEMSCQQFASKTLSELEFVLVNLGQETMKMFAALPALKKYCRNLWNALNDAIQAGNTTLRFEVDQKALGDNTNTPHLTLPFDQLRDSRHNYKTIDLNRLFKEREELRDSFLYQLRAFQDVRGRLVDNEQEGKIICSIKRESKEILSYVSINNISWFVNFFCDLLLQVGLVPLGETDSEFVRHIADQKRLQKLHTRFTSKSGQTNKSSHKFNLNQKKVSSNGHMSVPEIFQGHQEFFFLFIEAGDSYKFNTHLKRRLSSLILEFSASTETKGVCQIISKTRLLAKFLGLLVFSPNWVSRHNLFSQNKGLLRSSFQPVSSGELPLDLKECIIASWKQYRLTVDIPWIIQFLGMMKWDSLSIESASIVELIQLLWTINMSFSLHQMDEHSYFNTNVVFISVELDAFFHDIVGLTSAHNIPIVELPHRPMVNSLCTSLAYSEESATYVDILPIWFGKHFLFSSSTYFEDLCDLLKDLTHNFASKISNNPKKLKPFSVSYDTRQRSSSIISQSNDAFWSTNLTGKSCERASIMEKLVDSFFHQHKDLHQLCKFAVDQVLKNFVENVRISCVEPPFREKTTAFEDYFTPSSKVSLEEYSKIICTAEIEATSTSRSQMNDYFERNIRGALPLLASNTTDPHILDMAATLSINHAMKNGGTIVESLVKDESSKMMDEFIRKGNKFLAGVPISVSNGRRVRINTENSDSEPVTFQYIDRVISLLKDVECGEKFDEQKLLQIRELKAAANGELQSSDYFLRHYPSIDEFCSRIVSIVKDFVSCPTSESASKASAAIEVSDIMFTFTKIGLSETLRNDLFLILCDPGNLMTFVQHSSPEFCPCHLTAESIANFLLTSAESGVISYHYLEKSIIEALETHNDKLQQFVVLFMTKLASMFGEEDWSDGFVPMIRLQKLAKTIK